MTIYIYRHKKTGEYLFAEEEQKTEELELIAELGEEVGRTAGKRDTGTPQKEA